VSRCEQGSKHAGKLVSDLDVFKNATNIYVDNATPLKHIHIHALRVCLQSLINYVHDYY